MRDQDLAYMLQQRETWNKLLEDSWRNCYYQMVYRHANIL